MTQVRNFIFNNEVPDLASPPTRTPPAQPHRPTYRTTGTIWGPKTPQGAPGARNAQFANSSVREKYHFGDRRPKPDLEAIWEPKKPQGAPGARNAQVANKSVIGKYHFGDRHPKPDFEGSSPGARMEPPKLTTVLQIGHWPRKKVNTVPQIDKSFLRMSCKTRLQICKVDRRSQSRCADFTTRAVRDQNEVAKLDRTS